ncbi:hypothetical protein [Sulfuriflexus mobilis]|uniref:hypothetical protein n=1 Tax=Sulfuriflexus mobilis TaxID=1811807 RepID=UPI000F8176D1|nr:hypothetical protein [Sulfuriflexus mobilis]
MKKSQTIFFYYVLLFMVILSFVPQIHISESTVISRSDVWSSGIGEASILSSILLVYFARLAKNGSILGQRFCLLWAGFYSIVVGGITLISFPDIWKSVVQGGLIFSLIWFFSIRSWFKGSRNE